MKIITKTSEQAMKEKTAKNEQSLCPECGKRAFGAVVSKMTGIINLKYYKKIKYSCFDCGCQWETEWS